MRLDVPFLSALSIAGLSNGVAAAGLRFRSAAADSENQLDNAEYATIPINHDDSSVGTYQNRYWVNDKHYFPGGPVFVYDSGESSAPRIGEINFFNSSSWFEQMLQEFHGMGILWEHRYVECSSDELACVDSTDKESRYYGKSLPFPIKSDPAPEHMKYLTTKQALADIPHFAKNFTRENFHDTDLTPKGSPWVMMGTSYPGARSALTRQEYPDTIFAAFASSAPVQARINMSSYHEQVYRGMVDDWLGPCIKYIQPALEYIDDQLSNEETAAKIKRTFLGPGAEKNTNGDFAKALSYIYGNFQSSGIGGGSGSVADLCRHMETGPGLFSKSSEVTDHPGNKILAERLATWPALVEGINQSENTNCKGLDKSKPLTCELGKPQTNPDLISWFWQYCTEWGFFQINNFGPHALLSKYKTLEHEQAICNRNFPTAMQSGTFPSKPQADALNAEFGGWTMRPSNVYWSGGEFDPWLSLSPFSTEDFAPQGIQYTTDIPKCGVQTDEDTLFGWVMDGAVHGHDLKSDDDLAETSRGFFKKALREWLPCYKKGGDDGSA